ncbi:OmpA family protein [Pseudomonas sp. M47T1]|uniref:substrate-binding domain-containing protein n=1 Tax=unclassified Pseudomonas TaxID=196821 RepID=UPI000260679C|nr:phosphate ABC transporter substrate-binding/OmpA family protein [Pseudomonas sp. M47T1]EIK96355.1 OmpA family protein [Pseudomonas sp. M47T1]
MLTLPRLLLSLACLALPLGAQADVPVLRIQGSNTIGAELGPALVKAMLLDQGLRQVQVDSGPQPNEQQVSALTVDGQHLRIEIDAHGSSTGFTALENGEADLAAASRPIKDRELVALDKLGDLKSAEAEQVIAIDGVAVIVHPDNPLRQLSTAQLAQIFSGEVRDWSSVGLGHGPIHLFARDDQSGTWDTFKELVLTARDKTLAANARRLESSEQLSDEVSRDPQAIGFIGLPYVRHARALAIGDGAAQAMPPSISLIATEDYPLSRRLYFYLPPARNNPWAQALIRFTQSDKGQAIVAQYGFVSQTVQAIQVPATANMPADYRQLAGEAQRLSVNFRFAEGSASLDNKALADVQRVLDYLRVHGKTYKDVTLVGFGDTKDDDARALLLSRLRAMTVRRELVRNGVVLRDIRGLGAEMPVAANDLDEGRIKNRRVEVWVY